MFDNIGREESEFLVCAVCPSGKPGVGYSNIDSIRSCIDRNHIQETKKRTKNRIS